MRISSIICTWNRASLLAETLSSFERLEIPADIEWELIVVDNNSTDQTASVLTTFEGRLPLRRAFELRAGKSRAANLAVGLATGELLLWTDDDVRVSPVWLRSYAEAARAHADASWFGGPVEAWFASEPPPWIARNVASLWEPYALMDHGPTDKPLNEEAVVGANLGLRAGVARAFPFNEQIGPTGNAALRGEETELLGRLRGAGHHGWWVSAARVRHYIGAERLTYRYIAHWYTGLGVGIARSAGTFDGARIHGYPRWALRQYAWLKARVAIGALRRDAAWVNNVRSAGILRGYLAEARARTAGTETT
jgi:glycosyltransferase involved in cell wall biosynthesis